MTDPAPSADLSGDGDVSVVTIGADTKADTIHDAMRALTEARRKRNTDSEASPGADKAAAETPETSSGDEPDAAAPEEPTGETQETDPQPETDAPLDLPRSWTKDRAETWAKLDRPTQELLLEQDKKASAEVRRVQNEAAEKLKGLTAREQQIEQARQAYEAGIGTLQQQLQTNIAGAFADIKTMADVQKLAVDDPFRYSQWDAAQKQLAVVAQEAQAAEQRRAVEKQQKWETFAKEQDKAFMAKYPEFADAAVAAKSMESAVKLLKDIGFTDEEMGQSWNGAKEYSLRDHRLQSLLVDAMKYRNAQAKAKAPAAKPVPQVQQPGVARPRGAAQSDEVAALSKRLDKTGSLRDAVALLTARRAAGA